MPSATTSVYIEQAAKRVFAAALDWPGWARGARDEASALQALVDYGPRYAKALARSRLGFVAPRSAAALRVVDRVAGGSGTDFGVPSSTPRADLAALDSAEMRRLRAIIEAVWRAFDAAADRARGTTLARGPRGGGRDLGAIVAHVLEAERAYVGALGWKYTGDDTKALRAAVFEGMGASARGEIPTKGPRGGVRWKPRYFARRLAWHALDHAWEIEDRA